jgi:hypothetical protein
LGPASSDVSAIPEYAVEIPGEIVAPEFGVRLRIEIVGAGQRGNLAQDEMAGKVTSEGITSAAKAQAHLVDKMYGLKPVPFTGASWAGTTAKLRNWRPGDRVRLRYSGGPRKVKEVLERMRVTGSGRMVWPVLEMGDGIIWMRGVELEPEEGIRVVATDLGSGTGKHRQQWNNCLRDGFPP